MGALLFLHTITGRVSSMARSAVGLNTYKVRLDERRRPTLPPALLAEAGIAPGIHEMIAWVDSRGRLVLEDPLALLSALQDEVADGKASMGVSGDLVDHLLVERASDQSLS